MARGATALVCLITTLASTSAAAVDITITADNGYILGYGSVSTVSQIVASVENCGASSQIFNCPAGNGPEVYTNVSMGASEYLYIIAYDDDHITQGVLAQYVYNSTTYYSGTNLWEVYATGLDIDCGGTPSVATINAEIAKANNRTGGLGSSVGWVRAAGGASGTVGVLAIGANNDGSDFPIVCSSVMGTNARWMWYNANPWLISYPFDGEAPGEFLIFRIPLTPSACSDGIDNDGDDCADYPTDLGCASSEDNSEIGTGCTACSDGIDNDSDGDIDYPQDLQCHNAGDNSEVKQCSDGIDNDGDGFIDYPADIGCNGAIDDREQNPECNDGIDNDSDGCADYAGDLGCTSSEDDSEAQAACATCADGTDNDGDGFVDYPADLGCSSLYDDSEEPSGPSFPVQRGKRLEKVQQLDLASSPTEPAVCAPTGIVFFGGTTWNPSLSRWEALMNQTWTFESGVGSSIIPPSGPSGLSSPTKDWVNPYKQPGLHATMEGWIGLDKTFNPIPYFRRISSDDARFGSTKCTGSAAGLGGAFSKYSYWAGVFPEEANSLCFSAGQGYGNNWNVCIEHPFQYSGGGVTLTYRYRNDTEPDADYTYVYCTSSENGRVELVAHTGSTPATTQIVQLTQARELPITVPTPIKIEFCVVSDGAWSDQDGLQPTTCGAFAVDNITLTGAITHSATFESSEDGWVLAPATPGVGGDWSSLYDLQALSIPLTSCTCAISDSVLAFFDDTQGHNVYQDNLAVSPWIDLLAHGKAGLPGKIIKVDYYADLPLKNYMFIQLNTQWYPEKCLKTGQLVTSPWTSNGFVYYLGAVPQCTAVATSGSQFDFSSIIPPGAEQVRIALGCISYCRFLFSCSGFSNSTPWFDNVGFGVYGTTGVPAILCDEVGRAQDNFPANGTLIATAPGRIDCNDVQAGVQPENARGLGDTLVARGAVGDQEVYIHFKVTPGPGTNLTNFNNWYTGGNGWPGHAASPINSAFRRAQLDSAEVGASGPVTGKWMTSYHEQDPNFSFHGVHDQIKDPSDISPTGGVWRLSHDIFPDNLFTPGTRIDYFFSTNSIGSSASIVDPCNAPAEVYEVEILPSSFGTDNTFNCTLYVDHFNRGAQAYISSALGSVLGFGSENNENTKWDRYDVNAASSQQGSFGRPLVSDFGANVVQALGYRDILWNSGNLSAFNLTKEDADVLNPWLTLTAFDFNHLYLSGNDVIYSAWSEGESEPSAVHLIEKLVGVTIRTTCFEGSYRNANCPTAGVPQDVTDCVNLDPVAGASVAGTPPRSVGHVGQGNDCPALHSFDVLALTTPDFGISKGDERYSSAVKQADYASISMDASSSGTLHYKIVADGLSLHYRRDQGDPCDFSLGGTTAITERLSEVLTYFGTSGTCSDRAVSVGLPLVAADVRAKTSLGDFTPNPLVGGAMGQVRFTLESEGRATVEIFNIQGRRIKSVFDGIAKQGTNEATWDGTDETGRQIANGVYFYRLETADGAFSKKVIIVGNDSK